MLTLFWLGNCLNSFLGGLQKDTFQCQKLNLLILLNLEFIWLLMGYAHKLKREYDLCVAGFTFSFI